MTDVQKLVEWLDLIAEATGWYVGFLDRSGVLLTPVRLGHTSERVLRLAQENPILLEPGAELLRSAHAQEEHLLIWTGPEEITMAVGALRPPDADGDPDGDGVYGVIVGHATPEAGAQGERQLVATARLMLSIAALLVEYERVQERLQDQDHLMHLAQTSILKAIQAQVNPHFLFNTLSTLCGLADMENAPKVRDGLLRLATLLRYSLSDDTAWRSGVGISDRTRPLRAGEILLRDEIRYVKDYMHLIKLRFQNRLQVEISVPAELEDLAVPRMTLQPLVENVVKHVLEQRDETCRIWIRALSRESVLVLEVEDSGSGFPQDVMMALQVSTLSLGGGRRSSKGDAESVESSSIGLRNLAQRIVAMYGPPYGVAIESVGGQGSIVRVYLPIEGRVPNAGPSG